jgi:ssDNA-binding Zn-finger/Zn-ribbon topoisomerase 1
MAPPTLAWTCGVCGVEVRVGSELCHRHATSHVFAAPPPKKEAPVSETAADEKPAFACEKCGKALTYRGSGRKPRFCAEHRGEANRERWAATRAARKNGEPAAEPAEAPAEAPDPPRAAPASEPAEQTWFVRERPSDVRCEDVVSEAEDCADLERQIVAAFRAGLHVALMRPIR